MGGVLSKEHGQQGTRGPGIEACLEQPGFGCVCGGVPGRSIAPLAVFA